MMFFFIIKILKEVKGEVLTLKEQEMRKEVIQKKLQPKEITSENPTPVRFSDSPQDRPCRPPIPCSVQRRPGCPR